MAGTAKILAIGTFTSNLDNLIYTAPANKMTRVTHAIFCNGNTPGTITISWGDNSAGISVPIYNNFSLAANYSHDFWDAFLETLDYIKGGATTTANASYVFWGIEYPI